MPEKITTSIDDELKGGFWRSIAKWRLGMFITNLGRPRVVDSALDQSCRGKPRGSARGSSDCVCQVSPLLNAL